MPLADSEMQFDLSPIARLEFGGSEALVIVCRKHCVRSFVDDWELCCRLW